MQVDKRSFQKTFVSLGEACGVGLYDRQLKLTTYCTLKENVFTRNVFFRKNSYIVSVDLKALDLFSNLIILELTHNYY